MLVHPPREGFFWGKFWNFERITRLTVRREPYFVRALVIDADAHNIEVHNRTQLAGENAKEFSEERMEMSVCETRRSASYR